jgi:hypothetical protein
MNSARVVSLSIALMFLSGTFLCSIPGFSKTPKKAGSSSAGAKRDSKTRHARLNKLNSPQYIEACETYTAGHYADAMKQFQALDKSGMCCDMVHYYLALCCQRTNQIAPAISNYNYVVSYSRDDRLRNFAWGAASQLAHYQSNRTYQGHGNYFQGQVPGGGGGGGGCGG